MRIGELAKLSGTLPVTIRYYEQVALIPAPPRSVSGYRRYSGEHLMRLRFLRRCRDLGFSISEIRGLLRLAECSDQSCRTVTDLATEHLSRVRAKIADLKRLERSLAVLVGSCPDGQIANCRILESLNASEIKQCRQQRPGHRGRKAPIRSAQP
ncbi:MAG: MerR family transcriptional regulator [Steroidobacteraceae bacterium]